MADRSNGPHGRPFQAGRLRLVLTNDDGIAAPGLEALRQALADLCDCRVVAPAEAQSGVGHRVTVHRPIRVDEVGPGRFRVHGTPADCVRLALKALTPDADWIVAGINPGANLGSDVYNSGTVAAAREAAVLGCPAAAVSQYIAAGQTIDWTVTADHARRVIERLLASPLPRWHYWNVNLPHPLPAAGEVAIRCCGLDPHPHRYEYVRQGTDRIYQGTIHDRPREAGRDVAVCFGGAVAVTRMAVDATAAGPQPAVEAEKEKR